jgi:hypothetical protein
MTSESNGWQTEPRQRYIKFVLFLLIAALIGSVIILASVPPVSRDALTHHLVVPKLYLNHGGIYEIPAIIFSYYPMNLDLLYMVPLYWGNDIIPKFIHFVFALLTAGLVFNYLKQRTATVWALFGALFFLSLPVIVKLSVTVYVDLGLVFFSTAAILMLMRWLESRFQINFLLLAAIFCGLALGTKYNGLIVLFLLTLFIPLAFISKSKNLLNVNKPEYKAGFVKMQFKALGYGAFFCAAALLVFSPWMMRNYAWKGNPVYPLYQHVFNRQHIMVTDPVNGEKEMGSRPGHNPKSKSTVTKWSPFAIRKLVYNESWWAIALIPIRIFFQGQDDNPKYFDGQLNPFLFLLPFFAFLQIKNSSSGLRTENKIWALFSILFILYAYFQTDMRIRYIAPVIPPLVILATLGLQQITTALARRWSPRNNWVLPGAILIVAVASLALNLSYIIKQFQHIAPLSYIAGKIDRDAYIARYRPEHTTYRYVNTHLPDEAKILGLFLGNRRYYCDRDLRFGNNLFRKIIKTTDSSTGVRAQLQKRGFTHLLIRYELFNRWVDKQFDDGEKQILTAFNRENLQSLISADGYALFELGSPL